MKKYYQKFFAFAFTNTAKDTYILFSGNVLSAFLGFVYTLFVARSLSVSDFGVFSAVVNLVVILISVSDIGISTGVVNFVSEKLSEGNIKESNEYIKASLISRVVVTVLFTIPFFLLPGFISKNLLASSDLNTSFWVGLTTLSLALPSMIPFIIQAKKKFLLSIVADNSLYFFRLAFMLFFMLVYGMTVNNSMFSYALGGILGSIAGIFLLGYGFLRSKPDIKIFKKLLHFSGWIGVNRIITSISGRLDIQMLVIMAGTSATGLYSIPARLAGFVTVLAGSFSGVLATRLAGFKDKDTEKEYLVKATYALLAITGLLFLWIIIAKPFILVLFGDKYLESVPIFQALIFSMIPFMLTVVPVTAIIYAMKKTKYIGLFSFFQIVAIFFLNLYLIPIYGPIGPTISLGLVNLILAIYTWAIVINYYWGSK